MIPNTTQVPNVVFDVLMAELKGSELKVLLAVIRHTIGWIQDKETGRRREKDHISQAQLKRMTGLSGESIARAIEKLADELQLIEVLTKDGQRLTTPAQRQEYGRKHGSPLYRLCTDGLSENLTRESLSENLTRACQKNRQGLVRKSDTSKEKTSKERIKEKHSAGLPPNAIPENKVERLAMLTEIKRIAASLPEHDPPTKPKSWPKSWQSVCQDAMDILRGARHTGTGYGEIARYAKEAFAAGYTPLQWIETAEKLFAMREAGETWLGRVSPATVNKYLPEYVAGTLGVKRPRRAPNAANIEEDLNDAVAALTRRQ